MEGSLVIAPHVSACTELAVSKARFGEMVKKTRHLAPKVNERHVRESKIDIQEIWQKIVALEKEGLWLIEKLSISANEDRYLSQRVPNWEGEGKDSDNVIFSILYHTPR